MPKTKAKYKSLSEWNKANGGALTINGIHKFCGDKLSYRRVREIFLGAVPTVSERAIYENALSNIGTEASESFNSITK